MKGKLSCEKLIRYVYAVFSKIPDLAKRGGEDGIKLVDCLMSGLAMFHLKYPSLLQFDGARLDQKLQHNLQTLYHVNKSPCDTYLRTRLDKVSIRHIRKGFKVLFSQFQRSKFLKLFEFLDQRYLLALDATGIFESKEVHCRNCCEKHHANGSTSYYHQILAGAIVHPDYKIALPFAPEPIVKEDGVQKNSCERNSAKRFFADLQREHPHLKLIVVADGLYANGPFIKLLREFGHGFIIIAREDDHKYLLSAWRYLVKNFGHP